MPSWLLAVILPPHLSFLPFSGRVYHPTACVSVNSSINSWAHPFLSINMSVSSTAVSKLSSQKMQESLLAIEICQAKSLKRVQDRQSNHLILWNTILWHQCLMAFQCGEIATWLCEKYDLVRFGWIDCFNWLLYALHKSYGHHKGSEKPFGI